MEQDQITTTVTDHRATHVRTKNTGGWLVLAILTTSLMASMSSAVAAAASAQSLPVALTGVFQSYSPGTNEVSIILETTGRTMQLKDASVAVRESLQLARAGDKITVDVDDAVEPEIVTKVGAIQRPVGGYIRLIGLGASTLIVVLAASLATRGRPLRFLIGVDNRYSNSQTQLAIWFAMVSVVYLGTLILRVAILGLDFVGGIGITANLATLTGLSALSFGGAKVITVSKLDALAQSGQASAKVAAVHPRLMTDLFTNDNNRADLGDFQMIAVTLTAVTIFAVTVFHWLGFLTLSYSVILPDVDSSLLTGFGLGQGAYLLKKAAVKVGEG
jgi:hypothetical protein